MDFSAFRKRFLAELLRALIAALVGATAASSTVEGSLTLPM